MCDSTVYNPYTSLLPFAISFAFSLSLSLSLPLASSSSLFLSISLSLLASIRSIQRTRCLNYEHLVHLVAYLFPLNIDWILGWKGGGKGRWGVQGQRTAVVWWTKEKKKKKNFFFDDLSIFQEIFLHFLLSSLLSFPRFLFSTTMSNRHLYSFESLCVLANKFFDDFENLMWRERGMGAWVGRIRSGNWKVIAHEMNPVFPVVPLTRSAVVYDKTE